MTAAMLEPYAADPGNRGGVLFDRHRLARFIEELDEEHLNLHLHVVRPGANVAFSSDVISSDEIPATNPFVGLETAMTRRDAAERLTLEQALAAYTVTGSRQLGINGETGSLAMGKKADFIIVSRDPFKASARYVHEARADATVLDGKLTAGNLPECCCRPPGQNLPSTPRTTGPMSLASTADTHRAFTTA